jgi:hypothetical protein
MVSKPLIPEETELFLLQAPQVLELETFTTMPDRFRRREPSAWASANRGGQPTDSFLEGPVFDGDGNLYVSDIPFGRIFRIDAAGEWTLVAEYDGEPNGMKFADDHTLLVTDYRNGLVRVDIRTGRATPHLQRRNTESFKGVNDLVLDARGNIYFTDQGQSGLHDPSGRLYRLRPDGQLDLLLSNVPSPNGVALSPDPWRARLVRAAGHVRRQHHVVEREQRGRHVGLVVEHVEPGAGDRLRSCSAFTSACSSTTEPRATLTRKPSVPARFSTSAFTRWRVPAPPAAMTTRKSHQAARPVSVGSYWKSTPSTGRRLWYRISMSKPAARLAMTLPMRPRPTMPSFLPLTRVASGKLPLSQSPRRTKRSDALMPRATSISSANAVSATQSFSTSGV